MRKEVQLQFFDDYLTAKEMAEALGCSQSALYRWIQKGLPVERNGNRLYFSRGEVKAWLHEALLEGSISMSSFDLEE